MIPVDLSSILLLTVFINEVDNDQATQAVDIALTYIQKNPNLGMSIQLTKVEGNRTDSKKFLDTSMDYDKLENLQKFH